MQANKDNDPFEKEWQEFIKDTVPNEDVKTIERKLVVDDYSLAKGKKMVIYLEDSRNEMVNAFIEKNHHVISEIFKQWDYTFVYAPKEAEEVANHYSTPIPDVEWNTAMVLAMYGCRLDEPVGTAMAVIEDVEWGDEQDGWVATLKGVQLDAENERELTGLIRGYWRILNRKFQAEREERSSIRFRVAEESEEYSATPDLFTPTGESAQDANKGEIMCCERERPRQMGKYSLMNRCKKVNDMCENLAKEFAEAFLDEDIEEYDNEDGTDLAPETLAEEDELLLAEIHKLASRLQHPGIKGKLIEQIVKITVKESRLKVTDDARLLLTDYNMEVKMLPIDKVVYLFFLRHPEGVPIKALSDHRDELAMLYARVLGRTSLGTRQMESVERLCNPFDNSINEKISRIRLAFNAVVHEGIAKNYTIQGGRGNDRLIPLDEGLIELGAWG